MTRRNRRSACLDWIKAHTDHEGEACLTWPFARDTKGYGQVKFKGKIQRAHRVMLELSGRLPPTAEHQGSHDCGKGHLGCVNPKHLAWKTASENHLDRRRHGTAKTAPFGQGGHVLTPEQRRQVCELDGTMTRTAIAEQFGVSRRTVERTVARAQQ